jgi:transposase-like protein
LVMEVEIAHQEGMKKYEWTPKWGNYRNGCREPTWKTRVGETEHAILKIRKESFFPSLFEPRQQAEIALLVVVQEANLEVVSTQKEENI